MKTITLVGNFIMLGIIGLSILSGGLPMITDSFVLLIMVLSIILINIAMIAGSTAWSGVPGLESNKDGSFYRFMKIPAVLLNLSFVVYVLLFFRSRIQGSGPIIIIYFVFLILYPLLSIIRISAGKWNRFRGLKRTALLTGAGLIIFFLGTLLTFRSMIGKSIRENITIAKNEYPGRAEDALLAYLSDSTKTPSEKSEVAIWTLGQIRSKKALPVLLKLYKDDPEGNTCKGRHDSELCQYEIHKAIVSIEHRWMGAKEKNWFGSWERLNE